MKATDKKYEFKAFKDNEGIIGIPSIVSDDKGHAQAGWEIISGAGSCIEDDYYGFTIVEAPGTMTLDGVDSKFKLNGSIIANDENLVSYFPTLSYHPCAFTKLTIDSGKVIVYKR